MNLLKSISLKLSWRLINLSFVLVVFFLLFVQCTPSYDEPIISVEDYDIIGDFDIKVIASEPNLSAPVAIDFDLKGRLWVVEMNAFMQNIQGSGEAEPSGRIKLLEDLDKDGVVDHSKIIIDSLVMPRALTLVYGGLLYAEPPNLWFAELENDKVVHTVLVDSLYAADGNPEHQANGLMLHIDNWIYNAAATSRYQRKNGKWLKETTSHRGQWGITKDNFGRLYYNNNSTQLLGDYLLPNMLIRNKFFLPKKALNQEITPDQKVYPKYKSYVNRGYQEGVLDADSLLINVTSACAPFVYRGGAFGEAYENNVFVCLPEINAIKRNILQFDSVAVTAKQATVGKEFLTAKDRGFRPSNMATGPDGNLYVVDMHRGVIQHYAFLSPYLRNKSIEKQFDTIVNGGRIVKISKAGSIVPKSTNLDEYSDSELVALLQDKNGWLRDHAQHLLIHRRSIAIVEQLEKLAGNTDRPIAQLHALHTLAGLDSLSSKLLFEVLGTSQPDVIAHSLVLLEQKLEHGLVEKAKAVFQELMLRNNTTIDLYLMATIGVWAVEAKEDFIPMLYSLLEKYGNDPIYQEALLSGASAIITELEEEASKLNFTDTEENLQTRIAENQKRKQENKPNYIFNNEPIPMDSRTNGSKLYAQICASCHLRSGEGSPGLAPPLFNSEHITNSKVLASIILHGVKGPILVDGERYEFNAAMPGLFANETITDQDIVDLVSYVTSAFSDTPLWESVEEIKKLRDKKPSGGEYTEEELIQIGSKP